MSTEIETRYATNVLTVPIAAVTTRLPKGANTNSAAAADTDPNAVKVQKAAKDAPKPVEVIFVVEGDQVKQVPVKIGISDDTSWEILEGVSEGQEVISGGFRAISRDLEDGKKIKRGPPPKEKGKEDDSGKGRDEAS